MSEQARADLALIEAAVAVASGSVTPPKPTTRPQPKPAPLKRPAPSASRLVDSTAGARVVEGADDDNWDEGPDVEDVAPTTAVAHAPQKPAPEPVDPVTIVLNPLGFPDINADAELIRVNENVARLEGQLREATAKAQESCSVLGLTLGQHKPGRVEAIAEQLLAEGKSLTDVDEYEARWKLVRRLTGALELARKAVHPAREVAMRRILPLANEKLRPTFVAMHKARAELVRAIDAHRDMITKHRNSGFETGGDYGQTNSHVPTDWLNIATEFNSLVERGILAPDDVADLPGIRPAPKWE